MYGDMVKGTQAIKTKITHYLLKLRSLTFDCGEKLFSASYFHKSSNFV